MTAARGAAAPHPEVGARLRWSLLNGAGTLAMSILSFLAISRVVEPRDYGLLAVVHASWGLMFNAIDWSGGLVMRFGPVELAERGSLSRTLCNRMVFAVPPLAVLLVGAPLYLHFVARWSSSLVLMTEAWLVIATAHNVLSCGATAAQRFRPLTLVGILTKGAPLLTIAVFLLCAEEHGARLGPEALLATTLCGYAVAVVMLGHTLRRIVGYHRPERGVLRAMWRYGLPSLIGMPSLAAVNWLDPLVLDHFAPRAEVGRYQLAYPTLTVFAMLGVSLNAVLTTDLVRAAARHDDDGMARFRDRTQPELATSFALLGFGAACFAPPLVRALLPPAYAGSADIAALLAVGGGFLLGVWTLHPLVTASDSVWSLQIATILQAVTNVGLDVVLAPRCGGLGIALANVCAWAVALVSLSLMLRRNIGLPLRTLAPVCGLGTLVTVVLVTGVSEGPRLALGAILLVGAGVRALAAYRLTAESFSAALPSRS